MIAATARLCLSSALGSFLPPLSHSKAAAWDNLPAEKAIVPVPILCYLLNGIYPHLSNFCPFLRPPVRLVSRPAGHTALLSFSQRPLHQRRGSGLLAGRGGIPCNSARGGEAGVVRGLGAEREETVQKARSPLLHTGGYQVSERCLLPRNWCSFPGSRVPFLCKELPFKSF